MSKIEVDEITQQSGTTVTVGGGACKTAVVDATTVTLGRSGGTVQLASGASQTGFGRTGTVDWQTSIKTSTFTAANGEGYFVDTTSGAVTANLPAGSAGAIVAFKDYAETFDSNNLTISPNGSEKINNDTTDLTVNTEGESLTLVYADATKGWLVVNDGNSDAGAQAGFVAATGGTITTVCTNFKVHTFTGPGTFTVTCAGNACGSNTVSYLVVAGGGAGSGEFAGGGAGGFRESKAASDSYTASPLNATSGPTYNLPVSAQGYPITVGAGGAANGNSGANSTFSTITSNGGGGGTGAAGTPGGSGSGGAAEAAPGNAKGNGNVPPTSPPQGQPGGDGANCGGNPRAGGGGGGATAAGGTGGNSNAGVGGAGATTNINGTPTAFAGGGGGAGNVPSNNSRGAGGVGGGGTNPGGLSGVANTGGGGAAFGRPSGTGGSGGSGIVIIRYKFQ